MREIMRTNDMVVLSFAQSLLTDAGVKPLVADANISVLEGSIGVFPRRLMVLDDDWATARKILEDGGLAEWLIS